MFRNMGKFDFFIVIWKQRPFMAKEEPFFQRDIKKTFFLWNDDKKQVMAKKRYFHSDYKIWNEITKSEYKMLILSEL